MAVQLYLSPIGILLQQLSNIGQVLAGGLVNIYQAGTVNTPQVTYTDSTGTTQNANPLVLNSAGRLANSNAPVSVWVPANTPHKMVLTDANGVLLSGGASMDNLIGIGDPTSAAGPLLNPATGFGADLVANAMRSYDVVQSVRNANAPSLAAGQTLVIDIEGGVLVNDGSGGLFYWSATSTAVDDGVTVIKPNAILAANPGRYLRQANLYGTASTFQASVTGCTTAPLLTCQAVLNGNLVTVWVPGTGVLVSNSTGFGMTPWPAGLRDNVQGFASNLMGAEDNGVTGVAAYITIANAIGSNAASFVPNNASALWTASGNKAFNGGAFTYILPNGHP